MIDEYKKELVGEEQFCRHRIQQLELEIRDKQERMQEMINMRDRLERLAYRLEKYEAEGAGNG